MKTNIPPCASKCGDSFKNGANYCPGTTVEEIMVANENKREKGKKEMKTMIVKMVWWAF